MTAADTYATTRRQLEQGQYGCEQLVRYYLGRIADTQALNAYVEVYEQEALERARSLDALPQNKYGQLHGMVVSIKDMIAYEGHGLSAGSKMLKDFTSLYSATAVERLLAEGAILIGRTNCDEFGMGSATENTIYGPTHNAANPEHVAGGSSGGAAVAVQADTCLLSLGTDTGGSVRQPAAFCGVYGLKPTYGRVSRHGLAAYASSLDQLGLLATHPEPIATALSVIAGADNYDATVATQAVPDYRVDLSSSSPRTIVYWPTAMGHADMEDRVAQLAQNMLTQLEQAGHTTYSREFEWLDYLAPAYYVLATAEASANLARYDGIRFGHRSAEAVTLEEVYTKSRSEGFGEEVKRRIILGTFVLSAGYYETYYGQAQRLRQQVRSALLEMLADADAILLPTSPVAAWQLGRAGKNPVETYLSDIFTVTANLAGLPAISFPVGKNAAGLPIGLQLIGAPWQEGKLLQMAGEFAALMR